MQSLPWYVNRLKGMSAVEVMVRLGRSLLVGARRAGFFVAKHPVWPEVRDARSWLHVDVSAAPGLYKHSADRAMSARVPIFALTSRKGSAVREWNRDPLTEVLAPMAFGQSIDIRSQNVVGNIKYLWEPNRHQDLVVLAQAFRLTSDPKYLHSVRRQLDSWFEQCPYLMGPNWVSGLELAIRLINWGTTWQLIGAERSPMFDGADGKQFLERWLRSIYQHVHFVHHHYSRFSSANNHLIGEAAGVFIAACTWPFWADFRRWREKAQAVLIRETDRQNYLDGVNREQALSYQQFVLDFLILSGLVAKVSGLQMPASYWGRVRAMLVYIASVMDVRGNMPMIGDADDGYVIRLSQEKDFCPYRSLLATGAIIFGEPDFAAKAGRLDDKTLFLVGSEGWQDLQNRVRSRDYVPVTQRSFPQGGYYIFGSDLGTDQEIRVTVDAGSLGYLSIAAHGHADALAVLLSVRGREFLIDPGTYTYHGNEQWRQYFRGTRAHNTVCMDDMDQSESGGTFMWMRHANARCTEFRTDAAGDIFCGEHDGYTRLEDPVTHVRKISRIETTIEIRDTLKCHDIHSVQRCWHFSERCDVRVSGTQVYAENDGVRICLSAGDPGTEIVRLNGCDRPIGGWVSRKFDVKTASTSVFFNDQIKGTTALSTTIRCLTD